MSLAARLGDTCLCPMLTGTVPHVGGAISGPGLTTVLIGSLPAVCMGDLSVCVGSVDSIAMGSATVYIGSKMAARMGDLTSHGGSVVSGCATVMIGG